MAVAILLIGACFLPWVSIPSKGLTITGMDTTGTNFGKPALLHIAVAALYIVLVGMNKVWSKWIAFFLCAINLAWAFRNFFILSSCYAGECPERLAGIYTAFALSFLMIICALFADQRFGSNHFPPAGSQQS